MFNLWREKNWQDMLNVEENMWNIKPTLTKATVEEKAEDYRVRYTRDMRD